MAWFGGVIAFLLVLVVIAGIAYHARQKYAAQLDKHAQDQIATPESENQVAPSSAQSGDIFDEVAASPKIPASQQSSSTREVRESRKDFGIDTALPIIPAIDLWEEPSDHSAVIRTITRHDLLALIHRDSKHGWYDVIDIRSGQEGWVRRNDVRVYRTEHPIPAAEFSEEFVGTDAAPELMVANQTSSTLTLRIGDTPPNKLQPGEHRIPISGGTFDFYATVPGVIPVQGRETFRRGYRYKWSFWIERQSTRTP